MGIFCTPVLLFPRPFTVRMSTLWSKTVLWLLEHLVGITYTLEGMENLPSAGSFILASKHQSAWETIAFNALFDDPAFILKRPLLAIPFVGWVLSKLNMLAIHQGKPNKMTDLLRQAQNAIARGRPLIIFPEGTRTLPGQEVTYKKGLWFLYRQLNLPVVPVALNSGCLWPRRAWIKKPGSIRVIIGPPLPPHLTDQTQFANWLNDHIEKPSRHLIGSLS
jgi:1-acyl-sn-glycerol-3-phosphate acyltransferase